MSNEEFKAPDWINNEQLEKPMSKMQKILVSLFISVFIPFCLWAGWFEFGRAHQGHWRAWVYAFEWPVFGLLALYLWRKLMRGESIKIRIPTPEDRGIKSDE
jgi:hypothetical protein